MPADSERPALPHTWRPFGVRLAGAAFGGGLLVICLFAWIGLPAEVREQFGPLQRVTLLLLGGLAFSAWFALVRSRAVATEAGLTVVNGYRRRDFEWAELVAIHLPPGAPWAVLDLADGNTCPVMAIQGSDGARARQALVELRRLLPT
jgi:hypothetical protein